ncbi:MULTISPECIES: hypothetical protein [unclassified Pseudomonas]|uniref:hypothetical protein n=1 Tax=unclassified Pseudomonas TaxID=196821 RepID=UPI000730289E|nr:MULTISPECIES: hypothetical protein [unclassified Pseudomonas]KSW23995.1 hypothetical protein AOX63_09580 [Pseudomonas sp. ADP]OBP11722.1 hypothetical protein BAE52_06475 [Pseudomonas sp. EGD-AKN5]QOF86521.1 hypothetical protein IG194_07530 [Pseudomonas sp. ADPe]
MTDEEMMDKEIADYFNAPAGGIRPQLAPVVCANRDLIIGFLTAIIDVLPNPLARAGARYILKFAKGWMDLECGKK